MSQCLNRWPLIHRTGLQLVRKQSADLVELVTGFALGAIAHSAHTFRVRQNPNESAVYFIAARAKRTVYNLTVFTNFKVHAGDAARRSFAKGSKACYLFL